MHLVSLHYLDLQSNHISSLPKGVFNGLGNLDSLHLGINKIASIRNSTFVSLMNLTYLDLSGNPLVLIDAHAFKGLSHLEILIISETQVVNVGEDAAYGMDNLLELTADDPKLCCLFKPSGECNTPPNPFATCEGLLRNTLLRICIWLIGISALVGNVLVIAWRTYKRKLDRSENSVQMSFITNLAIADLLMGVYMVFIGSADAYFGADYYLHSASWRKSFACKLAGFVAMVSSEASVLVLVLISLDRFICIVFPFGVFRFRTRSSRVALCLAWFLAILLAVIPVIIGDRITGFYGYSDVCIGLPLVTPATGFQGVWVESGNGDTFEHHFVATGNSGWAYSTAVFIGLNLMCFVAVFVFYVAIFVYVRKAAASSGRKTERKDEVRMAMKMAIIVGTDFLCWMPVIIMGILSQSGSAVIPVVTYVWTIVFILPINSSLNPYLYTISTMIQKGGSRKPITSGTHRFSASSYRTSLSGSTSPAQESLKITMQEQ
ncbi:G-protein coupled receptor GRL101-like [Lytechinus pictus]|uniref:G-protein coupled receptor GRL101-like n=1 Tax=Lytechinus pictus TaxID=7653 RepID=UPI0030B9DD2C